MRNPTLVALLVSVVWNLALAADDFALLKEERIGPLRIDLPESDLPGRGSGIAHQGQ